MHKLNRGKKAAQSRPLSILKNCPKKTIAQLGENSPNLVTLVVFELY
jgi:hypothetical protein